MNDASRQLLLRLTELGIGPGDASGLRIDTYDHRSDDANAALRPTVCASSVTAPAPR
ncbi:hypothetical protein [Actinosynnema sp. NPDC023587]|uniref:hypothetical protein n=1 Tax=Actinosynnema sp. NPDC023587 TaxID=3154695 RepID=UPI0033F2A3C6